MKTKKVDRVSITGAKAETLRLIRYALSACLGEQLEITRVTLTASAGSSEEGWIFYDTKGAARTHAGLSYDFGMNVRLQRFEEVWQAKSGPQKINIQWLLGTINQTVYYSYDVRNRGTKFCPTVRIDSPPKLGSKTVLLYHPAHGHWTRLRADY